MPDTEQGTITDRPDDVDAAEYQAVSAMAVASLVVGLLALLAFWHPIMWIMPVAGVALGVVAVSRIDRRPNELLGRGLAVFAICLSLVTLSAASSRYALLNYRARIAARELGFLWFEALRDGNPELACQLTREPLFRVQAGDDLAAFYRGEPGASEFLSRFVADSVVHALLKLGPAARVRYVETAGHEDDGPRERIYSVYAVTYDEEGERKTFFVQLGLQRSNASPRQADQWWIARTTLLPGPPTSLILEK